jgi:hypothetical protein
MNKIIAISLLLFASNIFAVTSVAVPTITTSVSAGTTFKFTETLSGKLPTGYKVKIDLNNGKGLVAMTCSGVTCTLSSNSLPKNSNPASYKVGIYDAKGILQGTETRGVYTIFDSVQINSITNSIISYTKISNSGKELLETAKLGGGENDWACTKDNKTGLVWEIKTIDGGLRDMAHKYTNYSAGEIGFGQNTNSDVFVKDVNKQTLCGRNDWRLPTYSELNKLVYCEDEENFHCNIFSTITSPSINIIYFPYTQIGGFWTSTYWEDSSCSQNKTCTWTVSFMPGSFYSFLTQFPLYVRLVRG